MAINSLSSRTKSFKLVGTHGIHVLARLAAKRHVQEELRAQGVRVTLVRPAEIAERAREYLADHPELYQQALERARRMGWIEPMPMLETPMEWSKPPVALTNRVLTKDGAMVEIARSFNVSHTTIARL